MNQRLACLWRKRLVDLSDSFLPIAKWCELQGVSRGQVKYWREKLAEFGCEDLKPQNGGWLTVHVGEPTQTVPAPVRRVGLTVRIGDAILEVEPGCDSATLRTVLQALRADPC